MSTKIFKNPRAASAAALSNIVYNSVKSEYAINTALEKYGITDDRDKALAERTVMGAVTKLKYIDMCIGEYSSTPLNKIDKFVLSVLRVSVYQLLFMDRVPGYAVINDAVETVKRSGYKSASGFVNAVLRKILQNNNNLPQPDENSPEGLSVKYSLPLWFAEKIVWEKGLEFAKSLFEAFDKESDITIHINTLKTNTADYKLLLFEKNIKFTDNPLISDSVILKKGTKITDLPSYSDGLFYVQDSAANLAVSICDFAPGCKILDACASPGGKTIAAAIKAKADANILSCDISEKKVKDIADNISRMGFGFVNAKVQNAAEFNPEFENAFDVVIADVPCSGFGVISKKPDIRLKEKDDISKLPEIQTGIINNVSKYVKPGGYLIYSTCTLLPGENEDVVTKFLKSHDNYITEDFIIADFPSKDGMFTFWPNIHKTDGFFVAKLKRVL